MCGLQESRFAETFVIQLRRPFRWRLAYGRHCLVGLRSEATWQSCRSRLQEPACSTSWAFLLRVWKLAPQIGRLRSTMLIKGHKYATNDLHFAQSVHWMRHLRWSASLRCTPGFSRLAVAEYFFASLCHHGKCSLHWGRRSHTSLDHALSAKLWCEHTPISLLLSWSAEFLPPAANSRDETNDGIIRSVFYNSGEALGRFSWSLTICGKWNSSFSLMSSLLRLERDGFLAATAYSTIFKQQ